MISYLIIQFMLLIGSTNNSTTCEQSINSANYSQALVVCENEINNSTKSTSGELLLKLISITHELGLTNKNDYYLDQLKNISEFHTSPKLKYEWYRWKGMNEFYVGKFNSSEEYLLEALSIAILSNTQDWIAKSNNDLGVLANQHQNFKKALLFYTKSLDINIQNNNYYLAGKAYTNIGTVYQHLEKYDQAINHYKLAVNSYLNYTNTPKYDKSVQKQIMHAYESLLQVNLIIGNNKETENYAKLVIENSPEQILNIEQIPSIVNFARLYITREQDELAKYFLIKAKKLSEQSNHYFMNEIEYQLALLFHKQGQINLAVQAALNGLNLTNSNDYVTLAKFYLELSELTENNPEESLNFFKKHQLYREKLLQQKYDSGIKTIQYNNEKKQIVTELNNERSERMSSELKIKYLSKNFMAVTITLIILIISILVFYIIKKKEKKLAFNKMENNEQAMINSNKSEGIRNVNRTEISEQEIEGIDKKLFCEYLVKTMNIAVNIWEKNTATNRTELADQSGIWTISNDDGTLRTRSMDKYLSIDKIPKNPRWKNVIRTCHFILSEKRVCQEDKKVLEENITNILKYFQKLKNIPSVK